MILFLSSGIVAEAIFLDTEVDSCKNSTKQPSLITSVKNFMKKKNETASLPSQKTQIWKKKNTPVHRKTSSTL